MSLRERKVMKTIVEMARLALDVQDACNLSGVVHSFSQIVTDLRARLEEQGKGGTEAVNRHPICLLFSSKIASLTYSESPSEFQRAYNWCEKEAKP